MSRSRSADIIPISIEAPTVERLSGLLSILQATLGGEVKYINIYFDSAKKVHVAWFFCDIDNVPVVERLKRGN